MQIEKMGVGLVELLPIVIILLATFVSSHPLIDVEVSRISRNKRSIIERLTGTYQVNTTSGLIEGVSYDEAHTFYNIPYGQIPSRFMPSRPLTYQGYINATLPEYLVCPQPREFRQDGISKDQCLLLNINVPSHVNLDSPQSLLPVTFYVHGGSFAAGSGNDLNLEGRFFANATNTVFVTINYRLGPLGFMVYEESGTKFEGNQGLKDQQLALQWVQENIEKFGGDKNEITLFGESAGAQSVVQHLVSNTSKPLFSRAIILSTPATIRLQTVEEAKSNAQRLIERLNCTSDQSNLTCLLEANSTDLVTEGWNLAYGGLLRGDLLTYFEPFRPSIDSDEYQEDYLDMFQAGKWHTEKEVIIGNMEKEMGHISQYYPGFRDEDAFKEINIRLFGEELGTSAAQKYIDLSTYPTGAQVNFTEVAEDEYGDALFYCPSRALARFMASSTQTPGSVYFYINSHAPSGPSCDKIQDPKLCGIPSHASELTFVFRTGPFMGYEPTADDLRVYDWFSLWWGNFAYKGAPASSVSEWPAYVTNQQGEIGEWSNMRINPSPSLDSGYRASYCDFWDSTGMYVTMTSPSEATTSPAVQSTDTASFPTVAAEPMTTSLARKGAVVSLWTIFATAFVALTGF